MSKNNRSIKTWTADDVSYWLYNVLNKGIIRPHYLPQRSPNPRLDVAALFKGIDGNALLGLRNSDLVQMGVSNLELRKIILSEIRELNEPVVIDIIDSSDDMPGNKISEAVNKEFNKDLEKVKISESDAFLPIRRTPDYSQIGEGIIVNNLDSYSMPQTFSVHSRGEEIIEYPSTLSPNKKNICPKSTYTASRTESNAYQNSESNSTPLNSNYVNNNQPVSTSYYYQNVENSITTMTNEKASNVNERKDFLDIANYRGGWNFGPEDVEEALREFNKPGESFLNQMHSLIRERARNPLRPLSAEEVVLGFIWDEFMHYRLALGEQSATGELERNIGTSMKPSQKKTHGPGFSYPKSDSRLKKDGLQFVATGSNISDNGLATDLSSQMFDFFIRRIAVPKYNLRNPRPTTSKPDLGRVAEPKIRKPSQNVKRRAVPINKIPLKYDKAGARSLQLSDNEFEKLIAGFKKIYSNDKQYSSELYLNLGEKVDVPKISLKRGLKDRMKEHQKIGVEFLWRNVVTKRSGCILAHSMGLGKTFQIIAFIYMLYDTNNRAIEALPTTLHDPRVLILCPKSVKMNWVNEFSKWVKSSTICKVRYISNRIGSDSNLFHLRDVQEWYEEGGVMIMNYDIFRNLLSQDFVEHLEYQDKELYKRTPQFCLCNPGPDVVVADEGQIIKNPLSRLSKLLKAILTPHKICLSGFPLQNNLQEYWCMIDFVKHNFLGPLEEFYKEFSKPIIDALTLEASENTRALANKKLYVLTHSLRNIVFRLDNSFLRESLEPKYEHRVVCKLSELQYSLYATYLQLRASSKGEGTLFSHGAVLSAICNHPLLIKQKLEQLKSLELVSPKENPGSHLEIEAQEDKDLIDLDSENAPENLSIADKIFSNTTSILDFKWAEEVFEQYGQLRQDVSNLNLCPKFKVLISIIENSRQLDKILVFSQSLYSLTLMEKYFKQADNTNVFASLRLDGSMSANARDDAVRKFNETDGPRIFLISTTAGSLGINLVAASKVVLYDVGWNPSYAEQAIARAYRMGQVNPVHVYRLYTHGTWESELIKNNNLKIALAKKVLDSAVTDNRDNASQIKRYYDLPEENPATLKTKYAVDETYNAFLDMDEVLDGLTRKHGDCIVDVVRCDPDEFTTIDFALTAEEKGNIEVACSKKGTLDLAQTDLDLPSVAPSKPHPLNFTNQVTYPDTLDSLVHVPNFPSNQPNTSQTTPTSPAQRSTSAAASLPTQLPHPSSNQPIILSSDDSPTKAPQRRQSTPSGSVPASSTSHIPSVTSPSNSSVSKREPRAVRPVQRRSGKPVGRAASYHENPYPTASPRHRLNLEHSKSTHSYNTSQSTSTHTISTPFQPRPTISFTPSQTQSNETQASRPTIQLNESRSSQTLKEKTPPQPSQLQPTTSSSSTKQLEPNAKRPKQRRLGKPVGPRPKLE